MTAGACRRCSLTPDQLRKQYPGARYVTTDASGMMKVWIKAGAPVFSGPTSIWASTNGEQPIPLGLAKEKPASAGSSLVDIEAVEARARKDYDDAQQAAAKQKQEDEQTKAVFAKAGLAAPGGSLTQGDRLRLLTTVVRELIQQLGVVNPGAKEPLQALLDRLSVLD